MKLYGKYPSKIVSFDMIHAYHILPIVDEERAVIMHLLMNIVHDSGHEDGKGQFGSRIRHEIQKKQSVLFFCLVQ